MDVNNQNTNGMVENTSVRPSLFTIKKILRAVAICCIVLVFCPTFLVSCSGQTINVSAMTAVGGLSAYGEQIVDPDPIMLICLLIPGAVLVILLIKGINEKIAAIVTCATMLVDIIIWFIFKSSVKKVAEENYCSFKITPLFVINIILLLAGILLPLFALVNKLTLETDIVAYFSQGGSRDMLAQMSDSVNQMSSAVIKMTDNVVASKSGNPQSIIGYCIKCGKPLSSGSKFCTSCGTPVPESLLESNVISSADTPDEPVNHDISSTDTIEETMTEVSSEEKATKKSEE